MYLLEFSLIYSAFSLLHGSDYMDLARCFDLSGCASTYDS